MFNTVYWATENDNATFSLEKKKQNTDIYYIHAMLFQYLKYKLYRGIGKQKHQLMIFAFYFFSQQKYSSLRGSVTQKFSAHTVTAETPCLPL